MLDAVQGASQTADVLIMAAAVADYAPTSSAEEKLKKGGDELLLRLEKTVDVLDAVRDVPVRVGFAAESENVIENARAKLERKGLDLMVANDITAADAGFGSDTNRCTLLDADGGRDELPLLPKREVADRILDRVADLVRKA
jgi:phosphopantothenoylcysteine decarboxylase/phosphopantothenate--cysteine ligase